jgi:hypothetical protein
MTTKYDIQIDYLEHDGGTKFYETVVLRQVSGSISGLNDPAILIQRWGKIEQNTGGGQTKYTQGTYTRMSEARNKVLIEKGSYRAGKGRYEVKPAPHFGLGRLGRTRSPDVPERDMMHMVAEHYNAGMESSIRSYFGMHSDTIAEINGDIVEEGLNEPEPEIDRGTNWASW